MLIDKVKLTFRAGDGGRGGVQFAVTKKPSGGIGGDGGSVYLEGSSDVYDLRFGNSQKRFEASNGEMGMDNQKQGANGKDLVIKVPIVTTLLDLEGKEIAKVSEVGQKVLIAKGGRGGLGNHHYRAGQVATLNKYQPGKKGEHLDGFLELKLISDVIFVGLPNAGKSSMLNALSNASAKVAPYPFTTLEPGLAVAAGLILMDLPGLIEGTTKGKGLGTRFMKHAESAKLVAHFVSLESEQSQEDYNLIRKELEDINPSLIDLPELLVFTKKDMYQEEDIKKKISEVKSNAKEVIVVSIFDKDSLNLILNKFKYYSSK